MKLTRFPVTLIICVHAQSALDLASRRLFILLGVLWFTLLFQCLLIFFHKMFQAILILSLPLPATSRVFQRTLLLFSCKLYRHTETWVLNVFLIPAVSRILPEQQGDPHMCWRALARVGAHSHVCPLNHELQLHSADVDAIELRDA